MFRFSFRIHRAPTSTLFPYTTLFRSQVHHAADFAEDERLEVAVPEVHPRHLAQRAPRVVLGHDIGDEQDAPAVLDQPLVRSEEHTSELQSLTNLVCRLLLEKKNKRTE